MNNKHVFNSLVPIKNYNIIKNNRRNLNKNRRLTRVNAALNEGVLCSKSIGKVQKPALNEGRRLTRRRLTRVDCISKIPSVLLLVLQQL